MTETRDEHTGPCGYSGNGGCGHYSDCAQHNEPAMPNGPCNCGGMPRTALEARDEEREALIAEHRGVIAAFGDMSPIGNLARRTIRALQGVFEQAHSPTSDDEERSAPSNTENEGD